MRKTDESQSTDILQNIWQVLLKTIEVIKKKKKDKFEKLAQPREA